MADHEHSEPVLKVSDRRHFNAEGERRGDVVDEVRESPAPPPPAPAAAPPQPAAAERTPAPGFQRLAAREITFVSLLEEFYATALMQLGAMAPPGQQPRTDLEGARETIDILGLLQQKTHGNLAADEAAMLDNALYELRVGYTQVQKAATSRVAVPPPPAARKR